MCVCEPERVKWSDRVSEKETSILVFVFIFVRSLMIYISNFEQINFEYQKFIRRNSHYYYYYQKPFNSKYSAKADVIISFMQHFIQFVTRSVVRLLANISSTTFSDGNIPISVHTLARTASQKFSTREFVIFKFAFYPEKQPGQTDFHRLIALDRARII